MMDGLGMLPAGTPQLCDAAVRRFACRVVSELARSVAIQSGDPQQLFLQQIVAVARSSDPRRLQQVHEEMRRRRISAEQVTDVYLPAAIELIGTAWHEAQMDVLEATVAVARLQELLRELGRAWQSDRARGQSSGCVLLVLPEAEQHCLGAMLAASQLRRMGVSVRVELNGSPGRLQQILDASRFDALFLSVTNDSSRPAAAALVAAARQQSGAALPIVMGGGQLRAQTGGTAHHGPADRLGADLATLDLREALGFCGLQKYSVAAE